MSSTDTAVQEAREAIGVQDDELLVEDTGPLVAQPQNTVVYVSRRRDLVLVLEPRWPVLHPITGQKSGETKGIRAKFRQSQLKLDRSKPEELETIERLEKHYLLGNTHEGFWRMIEPAPAATQQEMQHLVDAAIGLDVETLQRFIAEEEGGFAREDVLETARLALARVEKVVAATAEPVSRPPETPAA